MLRDDEGQNLPRAGREAPESNRRARARVRGGDGLPLSIRREAEAVHDRVSHRQQRGRQLVLRSARLGVATGLVHCSSQGRRLGRSLVQVGKVTDGDGGNAYAALVERQHVRVSDAGAGDADISIHAARPDAQGLRQTSDRVRRGAQCAVGRIRICLRGSRQAAHLPVPRFRRARSRAQARAEQGACGRSICDVAGDAGRAASVAEEPGDTGG